jgi:hypothetical protein
MIEPSLHQTRSQYKRRRRELARQVLELYAEGKSAMDIAVELEIPASRVGSLLGHALTEEPEASLVELRGVTAARLDRMAREFSELARTATDDRVRLQALDKCRAVEADRARLFGLNLRPVSE